MKIAIKTIILVIPLIIMAAVTSGCTKEFFQKKAQQQKNNANQAAETAAPATISGIKADPLLDTIDDTTPYHYQLSAQGAFQGSELGKTDSLYYQWEVDCGYFWYKEQNIGQAVSAAPRSMEWRYDQPDQCRGAKVKIRAAATEQMNEIDFAEFSIFPENNNEINANYEE